MTPDFPTWTLSTVHGRSCTEQTCVAHREAFLTWRNRHKGRRHVVRRVEQAEVHRVAIYVACGPCEEVYVLDEVAR